MHRLCDMNNQGRTFLKKDFVSLAQKEGFSTVLLSNKMLQYFSGHVAPVWKSKKCSATVVKPRLADSKKHLEFTAIQAVFIGSLVFPRFCRG